MRVVLPLALVAGLLSVSTSPSPPAQCAGAKLSVIGNRKIAVANKTDRLFFRATSLELDFDGSPIAYGVRDQGQENICVGLAPKAPPCKGKFQGACYKVCQGTFATWSRSGDRPSALADTMCSVGLGGGGCSVPDVRLQASPNQDFFVSETSLKTSPAKGPVTATWMKDQDAQLDPATVRYLVVPGTLLRKPYGIKMGDVGVAYNAVDRVAVPFIVGDGGGLGEGSLSLLKALRPDKPPQLTKGRSALGGIVDRYTSGISGDFRFVIFKGTTSLAPGYTKVTRQSAALLPNWIDVTARAALEAKTNYEEVAACSVRNR